jgi:hypothetical protein
MNLYNAIRWVPAGFQNYSWGVANRKIYMLFGDVEASSEAQRSFGFR